MTTLLIDNHDSNTFNLFQLLAVVEGREPVVVRNDETEWAQLDIERFSRCVISAGPGRPDRPRDFGLSLQALAQAELPVLGVCLGHQGLVLAHGGDVGAAPRPMHGRRSRIFHTDDDLFDGIPQGFLAVRYHSLSVHEPLPASLEVIARTAGGTVMAVRHRERPHWGVQFHPESVQTDWGRQLVENFCRLATRQAAARRGGGDQTPSARAQPHACASRATGAQREALELVVRSVRAPADAETAFVGLFGAESDAFWLDSARHGPGLARFSYMGSGGGPLSALLSADVAAGELTIAGNGRRETHRSGLLDWLDHALAEISLEDHDLLPFDFTGGFVGYLGYELKAECGSPLTHRSPHPDALALFADRLIVFDHVADEAHVVCLTPAGARGQAVEWAEQTAARLRSMSAAARVPAPADPGGQTAFSLARSADEYLRDIEACQSYLAEGESYEVCLTNELRGPRCADALSLYRILRRVNPAPYGAFLRLGGIEVLSSSPERFLSLDRTGGLEAKPIKGTAPRGGTPREDREAAARLRSTDKERAENLMIVDVLRNDLGRVAEVGSVRVPKLMAVETYENVHQLVSTVQARLREGATIVDCLRATFPGGSMTGAPKPRAMEIIDRLETRPRGIYAGAIGYLAANGSADLSIAIRTIVNSRHGMTIGAGGAITVQSDPRAELRELLLKARAPLDAVGLALHGRRDAAGVPQADRGSAKRPARVRA